YVYGRQIHRNKRQTCLVDLCHLAPLSIPIQPLIHNYLSISCCSCCTCIFGIIRQECRILICCLDVAAVLLHFAALRSQGYGTAAKCSTGVAADKSLSHQEKPPKIQVQQVQHGLCVQDKDFPSALFPFGAVPAIDEIIQHVVCVGGRFNAGHMATQQF